MGAVALTPQTQTAWSAGETIPETVESINFARQQEIKYLKDYYENQIRMLQDAHKKEKRALKQNNKKLKNDIRAHKIIDTKTRQNYATMVAAEMDLQSELQQVKFTERKLQDDKDVEIINLKKDREERIAVQKKLEDEIQTLKVLNNKLQNNYETVIGTEVKLRMELERVKVANKKLNEHWESKMKDCEEEKKILVIRNEELQKEVEALKTNIPVQNLQLVACSSEPQQGRQCGIDPADNERVSLDNFHCIRMLGKGAFGTVVLARAKIPGGPEQLYAMKALEKRSISSNNICEIMAEKEALMLTSGHPFITTLYSCFQNKDHIFFVMEYMSGGDLRKQLYEVNVFSEERAKFYTAEITLAVQFLHQHGILHRDLKLENVLVGNDGHCKLADFGLSKLGLFRECKTSTQCGTPVYMAPEIVQNLRYGQGVDWWAVGVMLFEMMTGQPPFFYDECEEWDDDDVAGAVLNQKIVNGELDFPEDMSLPAVSILMKLLTKNPAERLGSEDSVDTVRQHPFFRGIDWEALQEKRVKPPEKGKVANKPEEDYQKFSEVLKNDDTSCIINQNLFQGFSFINYGVKRG